MPDHSIDFKKALDDLTERLRPGAFGSLKYPTAMMRREGILTLLDSDSYELRALGEQQIRDMGSRAVPILLDGRNSDSLQVRNRCHNLLLKVLPIELVHPGSKVTLQGEFTPEDAINELFDKLELSPRWMDSAPRERIEVDIQNQPFWEAAKQLCDQVGLEFRKNLGGPTLCLWEKRSDESGRQLPTQPKSIVGPICATLEVEPDVAHRRFKYSVFTEPGVEIIDLRISNRSTGEQFRVRDRGAGESSPWPRSRAAEFIAYVPRGTGPVLASDLELELEVRVTPTENSPPGMGRFFVKLPFKATE